MMKSRITYSIRSVLLCAGVVFAASSCVDDNSLCIEDQPGYVEGKDVWLTFAIANQSESQSRSRAGEPTDPVHPEEDADAAERYINTSDVTIMLADGNGGIMKVWNVATGDLTSVETNYKEYEFKARINQDYFNYATGADIPFSLIVVANTAGIGGLHDSYGDADFMQTPWSLSQLYRGFDFTANWTPDIDARRHIPMSGLIKATMSRTEFEGSTTAATPLRVGTIYMQRNLAKVRVVDALDGVDYEITAVSMTGATKRGSFLPYMADGNAIWAAGTSVVEEATVKEAAWYDESVINNFTTCQYEDDLALVDDTKDTYDAFHAYITEYDSDRRGTAAEPVLHITVNGPDGAKTYDYPVSNSLINVDMVRNHIYQFVVTGLVRDQLTINYCVCPWSERETEIPPFE